MAMQSQMVPLGTPMPEAILPDLDSNPVDLREFAEGRPTLVVFACNHCPYVRHVESLLGQVLARAMSRGVRAVAINSNDTSRHPDDGPEWMREQVTRAGWSFPYLIDEDQRAAKAFNAACTPDFFLYDANGALAYRGAFDNSTPRNGEPLTGELLAAAIEDVLAGRPVPEPHRPAMGCGIKWLPGNQPGGLNLL
jgi:cytochrome oxidase Cu insertion factor (SCO1/SenC/PrrC family)